MASKIDVTKSVTIYDMDLIANKVNALLSNANHRVGVKYGIWFDYAKVNFSQVSRCHVEQKMNEQDNELIWAGANNRALLRASFIDDDQMIAIRLTQPWANVKALFIKRLIDHHTTELRLTHSHSKYLDIIEYVLKYRFDLSKIGINVKDPLNSYVWLYNTLVAKLDLTIQANVGSHWGACDKIWFKHSTLVLGDVLQFYFIDGKLDLQSFSSIKELVLNYYEQTKTRSAKPNKPSNNDEQQKKIINLGKAIAHRKNEIDANSAKIAQQEDQINKLLSYIQITDDKFAKQNHQIATQQEQIDKQQQQIDKQQQQIEKLIAFVNYQHERIEQLKNARASD